MPSIKEIYNSIGEVELNAESINLNVDGLEALASTQQADIALIKADVDDIRVDLANGVTLTSAGTTGSAAPTNANLVGGTDGTNLRGIRTDTSGRVSTQIFDSSGTALTYAATGTAGTPSSDVVSIQGITGATPVIVSQSTATSLRTQAESYQGGTAVGSGNPLQVTLANTGANTTSLQVRPRNAAVTVTAGTTSATPSTSAQALASSATRQYLLIQNISDTDMYFNFGAAATTSHLLVKSGGAGITFESGFVPTDAVNVICSAASKSYYILSA